GTIAIPICSPQSGAPNRPTCRAQCQGLVQYRPPLDADADGIACEPYRGRF
ncbi:MAG: excalibur calcium-binding domain-containing protein, partial [Sphingopyxis sp.]|nr:excalibur calcium-binding domain-containing protein [Sphingopyxis sp.]